MRIGVTVFLGLVVVCAPARASCFSTRTTVVDRPVVVADAGTLPVNKPLDVPDSQAAPDLARFEAAHARAAQAASQGAFQDARRELGSLLPDADAPEILDSLEFDLHIELAWLRWAERDFVGALAELDTADS